MDILQQELNKNNNNNKKDNKSKKMVFNLILICSVLLILAIVGIVLIKPQPKPKELSLYIDGEQISINDSTLIDSNGIKYISLDHISKLVGYNYVRGGYLEYSESSKKCYLEGRDQIIGFEEGSKRVFKTTQNSTTDYNYFTLKNEIVQNNSILYIAVEDLNVGLNVVYSFNEENNRISVNTYDYIIANSNEAFTNKSLKLETSNFKNKQAISYGLYVVSGDNRKLGIVDEKLNILVDSKYSTIEFVETSDTNQIFIVSDDNRYGIITKTGKQITGLEFDSIEIINYTPLYFKVRRNNRYGVIDKNGAEITAIDYDQIGINGYDKESRVLIIEDVIDKQNAIVVQNNGRYGLVNIKSQKEILPCLADKIFYKEVEGKKEYYAQSNNEEYTLQDFINRSRAEVINLDD